MCQFVREDGRDLDDRKRLVFNEFVELVRGEDFVDRQCPLAFDAWEVVEVAPDVVAAALVEIYAVFESDNQIVEIPCCDLHFGQFHGALHDGLVGEGEALRLQGTKQAVGVLGCAVQSTELHKGLVVEAGLRAVEELVGEVGKEFLPLIGVSMS